MLDLSAKIPTPRPCVLIVDDDDSVRRSLHLMLQGQGYDVQAHATGTILLADPRVADAVCIIADYKMMPADGIAVFDALRACVWQGPAILVTAFGTADLRKRAATAGFANVIDKPYGGQMLLATVARLVGPSELGPSKSVSNPSYS